MDLTKVLRATTPAWTRGVPPTPPGAAPTEGVLFTNMDRGIQAMFSVHEGRLLHMSCSSRTGLACNDDDCRWISEQLCEAEIHFQEFVPPQIVREKVREKIIEATKGRAVTQPLVRHFLGKVLENK